MKERKPKRRESPKLSKTIQKAVDDLDWPTEDNWSGSHANLTSTAVFIADSHEYCAYCGEAAKPIQAGLKRTSYTMEPNYSVTGYTCHCDFAKAEVLMQQEMVELKDNYQTKKQQITNKYRRALHQSSIMRLKKEYEENLKSLQFWGDDHILDHWEKED